MRVLVIPRVADLSQVHTIHHEDIYMFWFQDLQKPSFATNTGAGGQPKFLPRKRFLLKNNSVSFGQYDMCWKSEENIPKQESLK